MNEKSSITYFYTFSDIQKNIHKYIMLSIKEDLKYHQSHHLLLIKDDDFGDTLDELIDEYNLYNNDIFTIERKMLYEYKSTLRDNKINNLLNE